MYIYITVFSLARRYTAYAVVLTKYCLNHCARTCCSLRIVTRCRFTNWPIRCERGGRNVHFLSINLISFRRSHGIVLVMASLAWEMDSASRQWNAEKDVRNVRDFSIKRLPSGGTRSCMPQQMQYAGVCADWEQKLCMFWSRPNPHLDWPRHCPWASSLVQRLWLASSNSTTVFGVQPGACCRINLSARISGSQICSFMYFIKR